MEQKAGGGARKASVGSLENRYEDSLIHCIHTSVGNITHFIAVIHFVNIVRCSKVKAVCSRYECERAKTRVTG